MLILTYAVRSNETISEMFFGHTAHRCTIVHDGFCGRDVFVVDALAKLIDQRDTSDHVVRAHLANADHFTIETNGFADPDGWN